VACSHTMTVLVVEDEPALAQALVRGLGEDGFTASAVGTAGAAIARIDDRGVRAIVLDLGLPDADGSTVLAAARQDGRTIPVVILTARDAVTERVRALDAGADDYLVKPFAFAELVARLRALLRRVEPNARTLRVADVEIRPHEPAVRVGDGTVILSPRERSLLELLLSRAGQVVARSDILRDGFGYDFDPGTNIVEVHLTHLRRKLAGATLRIETVRGFGYRVAADS
jgi:DNA-binding response OmpR family regulator